MVFSFRKRGHHLPQRGIGALWGVKKEKALAAGAVRAFEGF